MLVLFATGVGENLHDHVMTSLWLHSQNEDRIGANPFQNLNPLQVMD